ncbi:hypothetical protein B0H13DRAFT_1927085 [Mycena leptocephala]|nr:hypothetical protein B0H13DRAFT_1927085 [Mycena leptocephala]
MQDLHPPLFAFQLLYSSPCLVSLEKRLGRNLAVQLNPREKESTETDPITVRPMTSAIFRQTFLTEIVQKVFHDCLSEETFRNPSPSVAPLLLGRVCKRWRQIATSSQELWSSLDLQAPGFTEDDVELLMLWLDRAGSRPFALSLTLWPTSAETPLTLSNNTSMLSLVLDGLSRFECLEIIWGGSCPELPVRSDTEPLILQQFNLELEWEDLTATKVLCNRFRSPMLRSLTYLNFHGVAEKSPRLNHPWGNITCLHLAYEMSVEECGHILRHCTRVEKARFELVGYCGDGPEDDSELTLTPVALDCLHRLEISSLGDLSHLLDTLKLCSLQSMWIVLPEYADPWPHESFIDLIQRSRCGLLELHISGSISEHERAEISAMGSLVLS